MTVQRFEVVQDSETGRVELFENGEAFMGAPARVNLRHVLMDALTNNQPILISGTMEMTEGRTYTPEQVAALVEEMVSKGYDQMKARTLTTVEVALGQSSLGDKPIGRQIGYALDDAKRVMMDVLARVAPEITAEMLSEAGEARRKAEDVASYERQTERLEEEAEELRNRLSWVERRIKETKGRATRQEIFFTIQRATDENLPQIQEAIERSVQRVSRGTV